MLTERMIHKESYIELRLKDENVIFNRNRYKNEREKYYYRHLIHKKIISRIFQPLCSKKIRTIIEHIINLLGFIPEESYKIMDVSCGYDNLIIELAIHFKKSLVIGNDLNWTQLLSLPRKRIINNFILTKQDILSPDFCQRENYDLIICKNTLHHISKSNHLYLLNKLISVGKKVLIVEIENPLKCSFNSFIWNFYYNKFLKDDGNDFVCANEFNKLLNRLMQNDPLVSIFYTSLKTIKGNYLFAIIEKLDELVLI